MIDTGFTGHLTLPAEVVRSLALSGRGFVEVELADGSTAALEVYDARVLWRGRERFVPVYEAEAARSSGCRCCVAAGSPWKWNPTGTS